MYFRKNKLSANFLFENVYRNPPPRVERLGEGLFHVSCGKGKDPWQYEFLKPFEAAEGRESEEWRFRLTIHEKNEILLADRRGRTILSGHPHGTFGRSGEAWMVRFVHDPKILYYGMGQKMWPLERGGRRTKFWNTDVVADFASEVVSEGYPDPMYMAIPYVLLRCAYAWVGILVDHAGAVCMDTGSGEGLGDGIPEFFFSAPQGFPSFYLIAGSSAADVTRQFQKLCGTVPRPPIWALGYHQCRWGYRSLEDLEGLDASFTKHGIPCDGLWLDIDYMDRFKVFTFDNKYFQKKEERLSALRSRGRKVVPILDPGVKVENGYSIYEEGLKEGHFCLTPEGQPFTGLVWPGQTHFPDFSQPRTRAWWADHVQKFASGGASAAWLDMNDPAVGPVELDEMRFQKGKFSHAWFHNRYALGMAVASREGFIASRPNERPFLLSRSASPGMSQFAAVWTGDSRANWHHLRMAVPMCLNLSLSGLPFHGPDLGGFAGDTSAELMTAWLKTAFLFPFFRNHTAANTTPQEPWAMGAGMLTVFKRYVRLRYRFLPYLYQCFLRQEREGEPILKPLFYRYPSTRKVDFSHEDSAFLVGDDLFQAPILEQGQSRRKVVLPGEHAWLGLHDGQWRAGGSSHQADGSGASTPVFARDGAFLPLQKVDRMGRQAGLQRPELLVVMRPGGIPSSRQSYEFDDGISFEYQRNEISRFEIVAQAKGRHLELRLKMVNSHCGLLTPTWLFLAPWKTVVLRTDEKVFSIKLRPKKNQFTGKPITVWEGKIQDDNYE